MDGSTTGPRADRHPSELYGDILDRDVCPAPPKMREQRIPELDTTPIPVDRYFDQAWFQKEVDHVWMKIWQMACREEDIAKVGDYHIYEIAGRSLIVVRTAPDEIRALYNSCLHRGRQLVTADGCRSEFRCPYHGIAWHPDGRFKDNPIAWDFPQWKDGGADLPQAKVARWGGFVFVNFDLNAAPLESYIGPLIEHFEPYDLPNRYKAVHVSKVVRANWKVTAEAFMESHHALATHPQILPYLADVNSQYDALNDYVTRQFSASAVPSPVVADKNYTPDQIVAAMASQSSSRRAVSDASVVPPGMSARAFVAEQTRFQLTEDTGRDYSDTSDAEMVDALLYNVWPHMSFWAGYAPNLVYRWRPYKLEPELSIMDVMILRPTPKDGPRPAPVPVHELDIDEPWSAAAELGGLAAIFEQDMGNLPFVQQGLHASGTGVVNLARYSEMRILLMHRLIERWIGQDRS